MESCGLGPSSSLPPGGWEHSQVTVERDGRISATTGASPHGQRNETTFAQMLAEQFGVPLDHITIHHGDTAVVKQGIGTFGSRSQAVGAATLHDAGTKVKAEMAKFAAALLEAHERDLVFENGTIAVERAPASAKAFAQIAAYAYRPIRLPEGLTPGLSEEAFFEPSNNTYPFGCHIAMLEVDRETGEPRLLKMVAVDDAGHLINPLIVEGQIHGGLAQGIGQAMIEEVAYRRRRPAADRVVHGLRAAARQRLPALRARQHGDPDPGQSARRQGGRRGGDHRLDAVHRGRGGRRAECLRRAAPRHDAAARKAVAHHSRRRAAFLSHHSTSTDGSTENAHHNPTEWTTTGGRNGHRAHNGAAQGGRRQRGAGTRRQRKPEARGSRGAQPVDHGDGSARKQVGETSRHAARRGPADRLVKHPDTTPEGGGGGPGPQHKARVELDAKRESDTRRRGDKKAAIAAAEVHEPIRRAESENGDHGRDDRRRSRQVGSKYERRRAVTRNRPTNRVARRRER